MGRPSCGSCTNSIPRWHPLQRCLPPQAVSPARPMLQKLPAPSSPCRALSSSGPSLLVTSVTPGKQVGNLPGTGCNASRMSRDLPDAVCPSPQGDTQSLLLYFEGNPPPLDDWASDISLPRQLGLQSDRTAPAWPQHVPRVSEGWHEPGQTGNTHQHLFHSRQAASGCPLGQREEAAPLPVSGHSPCAGICFTLFWQRHHP